MLIKEYQGLFEEVNKSNDTKKNGKNDKKEVDKIMKDLKKDETIVSPKRCYWTLAD